MKIKKFKPFTITLDWLAEKHACWTQRQLFKDTFGKRVRVTEDALRMHGRKFELQWLVHVILDTNPKAAEFDRAVEALWSKHWTENTIAERPFRFTKKGFARMRVDYKAMNRATAKLRRARDKAEIELAIEALRDR